MRRLLALLLLFAVAGALLAAAGLWFFGAAAPSLGRPIILTLDLDQELPEHDYEAALPLLEPDDRPTLAKLYRGLSAARRDPAVLGVALTIQDADFGLAKAEELRRELIAVGAAGKRVACYLETAGEGSNGTLEYYLATACDEISLAPAGEVNLLGFYVDSPFLRGGLDKLKIEPSFLTAGEFKSAGESFTETAHSPAAREALEAVLDSLYQRLVDDIAARRGVDAATVHAWIDRAPHPAEDALALGLVDALAFPDQFRDTLDAWGEGDARRVELLDYARGAAVGSPTGAKIAVVYALGSIHRGGSGTEPFTGDPVIGSDDLAALLDDLAEDDAVAAVVLRIDSPGGSALASDLILRAVDQLRAEKPVIASFSDVAASGGYYIASRASKIVAEATTLTGSIGVVTGKLATGRFQAELLGVTHDPLRRGANADLYAGLAPFAGEQRAIMQRRLDAVYARFLDHVAAGRGLERAAVEAVAAGRVWSGADAQARGLVDELGGLERAIALAASAAGLPEGSTPGIVYLPHRTSFWGWLRSRRPQRLDAATLAAGLAGTLAREPLELELPPRWRALTQPF